jgi:hypothetical protein
MIREATKLRSGRVRLRRAMVCPSALVIVVIFLIVPVNAQKRKRTPPAADKSTSAQEMAKLRDDYVKASTEYKASLEKLLKLYRETEQRAETKLAQTQQLFTQGLISKREVDDAERAVNEAKAKVADTQAQIGGADKQIAGVLLEVENEKQVARRIPRGGLLRTTSFIRYNGAGGWSLSQAGKVEGFFQSRFGRPLPIAVFGQGAIHNRWRLDHHNAMDVDVHPDSPEGQALMQFLTTNGIPFSAFRGAIPGVATGPHIHVGLPSHRY